MRWFCRICKRNGIMEFGDMDMAQAVRSHAYAVKSDMNPLRTPNPTRLPANHPIMMKFPGTHCDGDIRLGNPLKKQKFDKASSPTFPGF